MSSDWPLPRPAQVLRISVRALLGLCGVLLIVAGVIQLVVHMPAASTALKPHASQRPN